MISAKVKGQERPTIGFISPDMVADIGGEVELVCTVQNGHEYPILWMRLESKDSKNTLPISTGSNLLVRDTRFDLKFEPEAGSYKLIIKDIVKSDEGKYQCQVVTDVKNVVTADVLLKVKVEPVMNEETESIINVEVNKTAELECTAEGYPNPKISWTRQDGKLLPDGQDFITAPKLVITNAQRHHRGNYVCTASNDVGSPKERVLDLQVGFPPFIQVPRPRIPQAEYYEASLECQIKAYPAPAIRWKKDGESVVNDGNHKITHYAAEDELVTTTLQIYSVYEKDYGKYTCEAGNRYGADSQEIDLYKSNIPICPPLCGDTNLNSAPSWKKSILYLQAFTFFLVFRLL